jgi:hypothetical protein
VAQGTTSSASSVQIVVKPHFGHVLGCAGGSSPTGRTTHLYLHLGQLARITFWVFGAIGQE